MAEVKTIPRIKDGGPVQWSSGTSRSYGYRYENMDLQKTFDVRQDLFQDLPLESLKHHFDEIMSSGYSVSLFWLVE